MSVTYIIASEDDSLKLDTHFFVQEVQTRWPGASIHFIADPRTEFILQFSIDPPDDEYFILGNFWKSGVSFHTHSLSGIVTFAQWYRGIVPSNYNLILYKTSLDHEPIKLTYELSEADFIAGFKIPFDMSKFD